MLFNYLQVAFRNLLRNRIVSLFNIFGLAVGISATVLILLFIQYEFSYDDFHERGDSIYRVSVVHKKEGKFEHDSPIYTPPIGPAMKQDFPEVMEFMRFSTPRSAYFYHDNRPFKIDNIRHADSTLLDLFSFALVIGDPRTVLANPGSIVLTEKTARRIFDIENPVGMTIQKENKQAYTVTGIIRDPPGHSSIDFNALISFSTLYTDPELFLGWDGGNQYITYVLLQDHVSADAVNRKFSDFMWGYINERYANFGASQEPYLQPLKEIHLYHNPDSETLRSNIYTFLAIALLILFIACINFINLTVARSSRRAKEVGVRKVLGANRLNLIKQFLTETTLSSLLSLLVALLIVRLAFPVFAELINREAELQNMMTKTHILGLLTIVLFTGILAGSYPAFYLSNFEAVKTLKGLFGAGMNRLRFRNILIVFQFSTSIGLIICTILVHQQLQFLKDRELGISAENIVVMPLLDEELKSSIGVLKTELLRIPGVVTATASSDIPHHGFTSNGYIPEGFANPVLINVVDVDNEFLQTFGIELLVGRNFSDDFAGDRNAYIINESLAKMAGWDTPLGKTIRRDGDHPVIGVVKDFHFATLHSEIAPLIITRRPHKHYQFVSVKLDSRDVQGTLSAVQGRWQKLAPLVPFEHWYLSDAIDNLYFAEQRFRDIFMHFSILAIFIALFGLMALASYSAEQRTKEIGLRKVLGSSVSGILVLLNKEFTIWVALANVIAWPVTWFVMNNWLENFAYRINMGIWVFALAGGLAFLMAIVTVTSLAFRVAVANPVKALRYE